MSENSGRAVEIRAFPTDAAREIGSPDYRVVGTAETPVELSRLVAEWPVGEEAEYGFLDYYVDGQSLGSWEAAVKLLGAERVGAGIYQHWEYEGQTIK